MWRTVSFVERVEVEFGGNIFNQGILFGDVDNDKSNELVVGNIDGDLSVFKGKESKPWRKCSDLGMITCVGVGDLFNREKNNLLCLTAEGWYYAFEIKPDSASSEAFKDGEEENSKIIKPYYTQQLPPNGKVMLTTDVDNDGKMELAIGYSDRVIRLFKWHSSSADKDGDPKGTLLQVEKWQLAGQIGSITLNRTEDGRPGLLASQPGGTYVTCLLTSDLSGSDSHNSDTCSEDSIVPNILYEPLVSSRARNASISTEIIGAIGKGPGNEGASGMCALCTLDGTLMLVENGRILWSLQVDHQLFSLNKLDVTGNGKEEVVCCSWDGQTYIVNHGREAVRYQFEDNVAAFTAGFYCVSGTENVPCFVYATFNNRIYIYYNISLPQVESTNLIEEMDKREETHELLEKLNIKEPTTKQLRELYHWCLYGWSSKV